MLRTALLFGVGLGLLSLLWVLILYWTGSNPYGTRRLITMPLVPLVALVSQWFVRRYYPAGPGLWRSVATGVLTTLFAAAVSAVTIYGFARQASPLLLKQNAEEARRILASTKSLYLTQPDGARQYARAAQALQRVPQPEDFARDEFAKKFLLGFLLAVPGGIFLRK